jgi:hypothetical protein
MENIVIIDSISYFRDLQDRVTWHSDYIKGVVDLKNKRLSLGGSLHADGEKLLIEKLNVNNEYLWGFNLYPDQEIEYESLINIKPKLGNKSILIVDENIRSEVKTLILNLIIF